MIETNTKSPEETFFGVKPVNKRKTPTRVDITIPTDKIKTRTINWIHLQEFPRDKIEWLLNAFTRDTGNGWYHWASTTIMGDIPRSVWNDGIHMGDWEEISKCGADLSIPSRDTPYDDLGELDQLLLDEFDYEDLPFAKYWIGVLQELEELNCDLSIA